MLRRCQRTCSHTPPGLGPSLLDAASRSACAAVIRLAASCPACLPDRGVAVGLGDRAGGLGLHGGELGCYFLGGGIGLAAELAFRGGALLGGNPAHLGGHVALVGGGPYRFQFHLGGGGVGHRGRRFRLQDSLSPVRRAKMVEADQTGGRRTVVALESTALSLAKTSFRRRRPLGSPTVAPQR